MKPSSVFVLAAATMFLMAACAVKIEEGPSALAWAYLSLGAANLSFALL